jgi:hypothetical protein
MLAVVVPARNEADSIGKVILNLAALEAGLIIPVLNGCTDESLLLIKNLGLSNIEPLYFDQPLGIDVGRAVGAAWARKKGAQTILFVDGDMKGNITRALKNLVISIKSKGLLFSLTDCYPPEAKTTLSPLASYLLQVRRFLNQTLGLEKEIGGASPSHGPHAISSALLEQIPVRELAIPPVALALAAKKKLKIGIGAQIAHHKLGSPQKDPAHCYRIAETILGDCLEAIRAYQGQKRNRSQNGVVYLGYHLQRRFDLLDEFLAGL